MFGHHAHMPDDPRPTTCAVCHKPLIRARTIEIPEGHARHAALGHCEQCFYRARYHGELTNARPSRRSRQETHELHAMLTRLGYSNTEIAAKLDISVASLRSTLNRHQRLGPSRHGRLGYDD